MAGNYAQLLDIINNPTDHSLPAWDNNNKLIEGLTVKQYLLTIISSLTVGYQFMGVASTDTSGGTPDQNVFCIAGAGTYNGFGSNPITIDAGCIGIIRWNGAWSFEPIKIADVINVSQNTDTGHTEITVGDVTTPVASTNDIQDLELRDSVYDGELNLDIFEVGYISCIVNPITFIRTGSEPWQSAVVAVKAGEKYNVKSYSSSPSAYGIAVFNKKRELLSHQDTSNTFVEVTIEQDGFLVVNHGHYSKPELSRVKVYSLEEKRNMLKDWILSGSYYLRGAASYSDGLINSPVTIYYPDDSSGKITLTRDSNGLVTALSATNVQFGLQLNMTILRNADGSAIAQSITFQSL